MNSAWPRGPESYRIRHFSRHIGSLFLSKGLPARSVECSGMTTRMLAASNIFYKYNAWHCYGKFMQLCTRTPLNNSPMICAFRKKIFHQLLISDDPKIGQKHSFSFSILTLGVRIKDSSRNVKTETLITTRHKNDAGNSYISKPSEILPGSFEIHFL